MNTYVGFSTSNSRLRGRIMMRDSDEAVTDVLAAPGPVFKDACHYRGVFATEHDAAVALAIFFREGHVWGIDSAFDADTEIYVGCRPTIRDRASNPHLSVRQLL